MRNQLDEIRRSFRLLASSEKAKASARFFKTGPGQYGEGDQFLGLTVPEQRKIARQFKDLSLADLDQLLTSKWHEERLTALLILVDLFKRGSKNEQKEIFDFYLSHIKNINNWDLVDSSAHYILGPYLKEKDKNILLRLAHSENLWERRISVMATFHYIINGNADETFKIIEILLHDEHDLIQKAVGWMLREIGKRVDEKLLISFLNKHASIMPRTALRYSIERLSEKQRAFYLAQKNLRVPTS